MEQYGAERSITEQRGLPQQNGAVWSNTEQYGAVWSNTEQYGAVWSNTGQYGAIQSNTEHIYGYLLRNTYVCMLIIEGIRQHTPASQIVNHK